MSFEERLALLVDREVHGRQDRRCARLLKVARLKYPQAAVEDLDSRPGRGIQRSAVMSLALGQWVQSGHAVLITGPTGSGKSWLACALAQHACRRGFSAYYQRVPRLSKELRIRHAICCLGASRHLHGARTVDGVGPSEVGKARPKKRKSDAQAMIYACLGEAISASRE